MTYNRDTAKPNIGNKQQRKDTEWKKHESLSEALVYMLAKPGTNMPPLPIDSYRVGPPHARAVSPTKRAVSPTKRAASPTKREAPALKLNNPQARHDDSPTKTTGPFPALPGTPTRSATRREDGMSDLIEGE